MNISRLALSALVISAAFSLVVACGNGASQAPPLAPNATNAVHLDEHRSWMVPDVKKKNLLYVSEGYSGGSGSYVLVYSYPDGKLLGTLTGFDDPQGLCVDKKGNIFVTNYQASEILEYAHGGTAPIETLSEPGNSPFDCAVEPKTGNLAVANISAGTQGGNVAIYSKAKGTPKIYTDPEISAMFYCAYDIDGNLYVDGELIGSPSAFGFAELAKGSSTFTNISLNHSIAYAGGVQWDGKYVAIGDSDASEIDQFSISGSNGTLEGSTLLNGTNAVNQFWIRGAKVTAPDVSAGTVMSWDYPAGGNPTKTISGLAHPNGSAVSMAKAR